MISLWASYTPMAYAETQSLSARLANDFVELASQAEDQARPSISPLPHEAKKPLPSIYTLHINQQRISAEIAATDRSRAQGLMYRFDLPQNYGMLFVFPDSQQRCFWMKNTYIPLSIAYIGTEGEIVSIHDMQAHDLSSVCSAAPAMFALEVKQGWFAEKGIKIGDTIRIEQHHMP